ncbi:MAG: hypothetical protein ALAOOOJD_01243 [bacterium]|nr:hypothetical protein [bacterium]
MRKVIGLLLLLSSFAFGQRADFFKEDITFHLDGIYLHVEGYYWFANHSDKPVHSDIYYPFPIHAGDQIDSIRVYNISAGRETGFQKEDKFGLSFMLHFAALDTILLQIKYRQKLKADSAVYILQTTRGWGKPLNDAEFKLITPASFQIKKFSYPPDASFELEKLKIYHWKKENFMPAEDMIFTF